MSDDLDLFAEERLDGAIDDARWHELLATHGEALGRALAAATNRRAAIAALPRPPLPDALRARLLATGPAAAPRTATPPAAHRAPPAPAPLPMRWWLWAAPAALAAALVLVVAVPRLSERAAGPDTAATPAPALARGEPARVAAPAASAPAAASAALTAEAARDARGPVAMPLTAPAEPSAPAMDAAPLADAAPQRRAMADAGKGFAPAPAIAALPAPTVAPAAAPAPAPAPEMAGAAAKPAAPGPLALELAWHRPQAEARERTEPFAVPRATEALDLKTATAAEPAAQADAAPAASAPAPTGGESGEPALTITLRNQTVSDLRLPPGSIVLVAVAADGRAIWRRSLRGDQPTVVPAGRAFAFAQPMPVIPPGATGVRVEVQGQRSDVLAP